MGCSPSKSSPPPQKMNFKRADTAACFDNKKKLNKEDYIFSKRGVETLIKSPNDINGQQFVIEDSEGSDMFLIDHIGMLTVVCIILNKKKEYVIYLLLLKYCSSSC